MLGRPTGIEPAITRSTVTPLCHFEHGRHYNRPILATYLHNTSLHGHNRTCQVFASTQYGYPFEDRRDSLLCFLTCDFVEPFRELELHLDLSCIWIGCAAISGFTISPPCLLIRSCTIILPQHHSCVKFFSCGHLFSVPSFVLFYHYPRHVISPVFMGAPVTLYTLFSTGTSFLVQIILDGIYVLWYTDGAVRGKTLFGKGGFSWQ